ncbi:hypothetical protein PROFUN_16424 [Planoprotostelium fungivorum]|uniref:Uncharacterized protein n=1 Tax=Planoprotostelium fungivorum TaxID=1890364 RepID=A0A2P6MQP2_9EUKA|nr:hypothetical protein PROFUN_16424 [Planoprotostelium fungivorum]
MVKNLTKTTLKVTPMSFSPQIEKKPTLWLSKTSEFLRRLEQLNQKE